MRIPEVPRERIGHSYLGAILMIVLALMNVGGFVLTIFGFGLLVWTAISDHDDDNHIDPPGTEYVNNREVRT